MKKLMLTLSLLGLIMLSGCIAAPVADEATQASDNSTSKSSMQSAELALQNKDTNVTINKTFMQTAQPKAGDLVATLTTNHGVMKAVLFGDKVPHTVENFTELAKANKYDGTIFHRIIMDFMIQGGDFENKNGTGGYTFKGPGTMMKDEFNPDLKNIHGALSMANRGPNTNGSQFFIVHALSTPWLDGKHAVFGQVYEGLSVLDEIATVEVDALDVPTEEVVLEKVEISVFE